MPEKANKPPLLDQRLVRALGHPARVEILKRLTDEVLSPKQLAQRLPWTLSHLSYHVRVLEENDVLELVRQKQRRGAIEHFFRATSESFIGAPGWRRVPGAFLGIVAGASLQSFIDKAFAALRAGKLDDEQSAFVWLPLVLDQRGRDEITEFRETGVTELLAIEMRSKRRLAQTEADGTRYVVALANFEAAGQT